MNCIALKDHVFSVLNQSENPNRTPDFFLTSLTITEMNHCGRSVPFKISLHPHFNAIIGGRGTGKSTVIESIRIAMEKDNSIHTDLMTDLKIFKGNISNKGVMQTNTKLEASYNRRTNLFTIGWEFNDKRTILDISGKLEYIENVSAISDRFPIAVYSQKEIITLASNPQGLLNIIDSSAEVNIVECQSRWQNVVNDFLAKRKLFVFNNNKITKKTQIITQISDLDKDISLYETRGDGKILKEYQVRAQQEHHINVNLKLDKLVEKLTSFQVENIPSIPNNIFVSGSPEQVEINAIHEKFKSKIQNITSQIIQFSEQINTALKERNLEILSTQWYHSFYKAYTDYENIKKSYEEKKQELNLEVYTQWVKRRSELQYNLSEIEKIERENVELKKQTDDIFEQLIALRKELQTKRQTFIDKVIGDSPYVKMSVILFGSPQEEDKDFRQQLGLLGEIFKSDILDIEASTGILKNLYMSQESNIHTESFAELVHDLKMKIWNIVIGKDSSVHGKMITRLKESYENDPTFIDRLWCWWPEDSLHVRFGRGDGHFAELHKGSAGQKSAAILAFLLSHGTVPLVIDQPEDDLDNALISDLIVRQIKENKKNRQIIIVTHNPNIVVNGDAELVMVLDFRKGQVHLAAQGGLGDIKIRNDICKIMEGGEDAFRSRYHRIIATP
jgi:ABC-type lipoprotein export system ATPase subunit